MNGSVPGVRAARPEDLAAVLAVERASFGPAAWTETMFQAEFEREGGVFLVLERDGAVVGHAVGRLVIDEAEVLELAVHPGLRRLGLGALLLRTLEDALAAAGAATIWLEVRADNAAAKALYTGAGYAKTGLRRRYYPDGQDAVLMSRPLL